MKIKVGTIIGLAVLFLNGCSRYVSPGPPTPAALSTSPPNVRVHWDKPEFLCTDASDAPMTYPINPDGTLVSSLSHHDIDTMSSVPARFETYISSLAVSPDHCSILFRDSTRFTDRLGRYRVERWGQLKIRQVLVGGNKTYFPKSMAFLGHERFLYVMYNQHSASSSIPSHYVIMAYRFGVDGNAERLPGLPVVAAPYTTSAFVANPEISVAYAVTGPSAHFLYVVRPEDRFLDIYRVGPNGALSIHPFTSIALGYRAGRSVFHPDGHTLYVADADHAFLVAYRVGGDGLPVRLSQTTPGSDPVLDPHGRFLYAASSDNRSLLCYNVMPHGMLRQVGSTATHNLCFAPCVDATGRFVYAIAKNPDRYEPAISQFCITSNGMLVPLQPEEVPAGGCTTLTTVQASP